MKVGTENDKLSSYFLKLFSYRILQATFLNFFILFHFYFYRKLLILFCSDLRKYSALMYVSGTVINTNAAPNALIA